jgi:hypothetical protein
MSTPIYQIAINHKNTSTSLALKSISPEDYKAMMEKQEASLKAVQGEAILVCDSAWADEEHPWWVVIRFPSLEARLQHTQKLTEIGWLDWVDAFTLLGTAMSEPAPVTFPNPIYKLWLIHNNPAGAQAEAGLGKGAVAALEEKHNAIYAENGSVLMLQCYSYWCNEAYPYFGVSAYPSIEANMKVMQALDDLGWRTFTESFTLLGTPMKEG